MKLAQLLLATLLYLFLFSTTAKADIYYVTSQQEFNSAHDDASANDSIVWKAGTYSDIFMDIDKNRLFIMAERLGQTIFTGASRVDITGDYITLKGFQFVGGDIGTRDVINTRGSYNHFTQINIRAYTCYKYLRVREESQYVDITYCNFENRLNLDDQNILSILVDDNNPGYHKIQYCSFKNFEGVGNDMGIEPIRIGLSTQADHVSRTLVEHCYFTQCDGDGELISSKATQNVYRFNTFERNSKAELVLRHGSEAIVYGNFFLNGKGGVRVREGQEHYIYNNYFFGLDDRAIYLQNNNSDPLDNINIAFNTIFECAEVRLGGSGSNPPTNVTFSNNIFAAPDDALFDNPTGSETWIGNIASGDLGMTLPATGMRRTNPLLDENSEGYFGLDPNSPAIDAALPGYASLPKFPGIDDIDSDVLFDLMGQNRPQALAEKDLGCSEFPQNTLITPIATEENTGPSYNTSTLTDVENTPIIVKNLIQIVPNPALGQINLTLRSATRADISIDIFDLNGRKVDSIAVEKGFSGEMNFLKEVGELASGVYTVRVVSRGRKGEERIQIEKFVKL